MDNDSNRQANKKLKYEILPLQKYLPQQDL